MEKIVFTSLFFLNFVIAQETFRNASCIGGFNEIGFVINNNCSAGSICVPFKDGWFCVEIDESYFFYNQWNDHHGVGRTTDLICDTMLCQYGSSCLSHECKCLKHFTGTYCGNHVNYCAHHSCQNGATCLQRLGGYNCACTVNHIGRYCEHFDLKDLNPFLIMKDPDFLFDIFQYANVEYTYVFFSKHLGLLPKVTIDFGDGSRAQKIRLTVLENATQALTQLFRLPLNFKYDELQVFTFNHTFGSGSLYEVEVNGWNGHFHIFNTTYQIRVVTIESCTLNIVVHNSTESKEGAKFYKKSAIFFPTAVRSNCSTIIFSSNWTLYKVNMSADSNSTQKLFIDPKINVGVPNLYIPPYIMEEGLYLACISVTITQPVKKSDETCTRFKILREALVAHIQEGSVVTRPAKKMFRLDANLSFDPNFHINEQPPLVYTWTCEPKNKFCRGSSPLNETGPILVVPSDALQENIYNFQVSVNHGFGSTKDNYTGTAEQIIKISDTTECFFFINCIKNCVGGRVNTKKTMVMNGVMECKSKIDNFNLQFCWEEVKKDSKDYENTRLNDSDYYREINEVIIYENQLQLNTEYIFKFFTDNSSATFGKPCEVKIKTFDYIPVGTCTVVPSSGIAMWTIFTINCTNVFPKNLLPVLYEVEQIVYVDRPKYRGILHMYSLTELITRITLGAGISENDYLTNLQVSLTCSNGITASSIYEVTVYPVYYHSDDPAEVWSYISLMIKGKMSLLSTYLQNGNEYEVIQQMISIATSAKDIYKNVNFNEINFPIDILQNSLINYLIDIPTSNIYTIRYVISAMKTIVKMAPQKNSIWTPVTVNVIRFMKTMLGKLKIYYKGKEEILGQLQIEILCMDFLDIASRFLKLPSPDFKIFREDLTELVSAMSRYTEVENMNPYHINKDVLLTYNSRLLVDLFFDMMKTYLDTLETANMRPSVITSSGIALLVQKHLPRYVSSKPLSVSKRVNINFTFNSTVYEQNNSFDFKILVIDNHPDWYSYKDEPSYSFPYVKVVVSSNRNQPQIIPVDLDLHPTNNYLSNDTEFIHKGSLPIKLFWEYDDRDIQIHKIILATGGKLMVKFKPLQKKHTIVIVLKRLSEPTMSDFWKNGIIIPQQVTGGGWSVFVDDPINDELTLYYLGVFMDTKTMKELNRNQEQVILDQDFQYEDLPAAKVKRNADQEKIKENKVLEHINYEFSAYSVYCFSYKDHKKHWTWKNCNVRFVTSSQVVRCTCFTNTMITAHFKATLVDSTAAPKTETELLFDDNPIIVFIIVFTCFLFVGLFKWTIQQDKQDMLRRTVCFLVDNYPECEYTYLLIVYSGRHVKAGTTSNITVELEGTLGISYPHVLRDWARPVLIRGSQDWFVIKTKESLGEIYCIHMWADFSGEKPNWFCDKIIVHDIQCQKIWFFVIKQWFDPLMGDGSMSYTTYPASDEIIFSSSHYFEEVLFRELDAGMHGWLSIFYKYPYNNYTRTQRAGVAFTHLSMMMLILIYSYGLPQFDVPQDQLYTSGDYNLEWKDLYIAFVATLIAFPIHLLLVCFFRSIKPSSRWIESRLDRSLSRFNMDSDSSYDIMWISSEIKSMSSRIRVTNRRSKESDKKTTYSSVQSASEFKVKEYESGLSLKYNKSRTSKPTSKLIKKIDNLISLKDSLTDTDSGSFYDRKSFDYPKHPKKKQTVSQSYFFQPFYSYIAWILLLTITIPSIYAVLLYGVCYGWMMSLHYLTSLFIAVVISICFLETLKWFLWSTLLFFKGRQVYAIEDRTDLVIALNSEFMIPESLRNRIVRKINKLRENSVYQPLLSHVLYKIKKIRISSFLRRMMISKLLLLVLFALLQAVMFATVYIPNSYLHISNLKNLVMWSNSTRLDFLSQIQSKNDLIEYIRTVLIPNLQDDKLDIDSSTLNSTVDGVNYLIGVIQLRQVRKDQFYCNINQTPHWKTNCPEVYDTQNYNVGWGRLNASTINSLSNITWFDIFTRPWQYENKQVYLHNSIIYQNRSRYPHGAYEVDLARTKNESLNIIKCLETTYWFDDLTAVVYIDFVLYNPSIYSLAAISIMAERTDQGLYYVNQKYMYDILHPTQTYGQMYLLIYLVIAFIWLTMFIYMQSRKYTIIRKKKYLSPTFGLRRKLFLILTVISVIIHINKTINLDYFNGLIQNANTEKYASIGSLIFMGNCMSCTITLMFILVVVEFICILSTSLRMKFVITVCEQAIKEIFLVFLFYLVVMAAFNWAYYMNFGTNCYHYRTILSGINNQLMTLSKNVNSDYYSTHYNSIVLSALLYFTYIISMVCIWRSFAAAIIISVYCKVKRNRRQDLRCRHTSVLNNYAKKYFDSIDGQSNRKQQKFDNYYRRLRPRMKMMGYLVSDWYNYKTKDPQNSKNYRHEAMKIVLLEELKKVNYFIDQGKSAIEEDDEQKTEYTMLQIMRVVVLKNVMINHLNHLTRKIQSLLKHNVYT